MSAGTWKVYNGVWDTPGKQSYGKQLVLNEEFLEKFIELHPRQSTKDLAQCIVFNCSQTTQANLENLESENLVPNCVYPWKKNTTV